MHEIRAYILVPDQGILVTVNELEQLCPQVALEILGHERRVGEPLGVRELEVRTFEQG